MKNSSRVFHPGWLVVLGLFCALPGCGSDASKTKVASGNDANSGSTGQQAAAAPASRGDNNSPTSGSVKIDERILKACGDIPNAHFAFDSAAIQGDAATSLGAVARCFKTGALAGKGVRLVGHADPRGETEYNLGLGHKRASSVASFLGKQGLEKGKLETTSRGELEASGVDEEGWAKDRRVDVFLAE